MDIPLELHSLAVIDWSTAISSLVIFGIALIVLLFMSAMVSGSEVAFFSIGPNEKEELLTSKSKSATVALQLLEKPKRLLATILIANNFINVAIIVICTYLSDLIFPFEGTSKFLIDVVAITFILLLFGEVIPKIYATKHVMQMTLIMSKPLSFFGKLPPFSWLKIGLVKGTSVISNLGRIKAYKVSTDNLSQAVELTIDETHDQGDKKIWQDIVKFGEKDVKQIMRPRVDIEAIDVASKFSEVYARIVESKFSRIPVFTESFDKVEGILFTKDLLPHIEEDDTFEWQKLIREAMFVPENKKIDDLMNDFQDVKTHMAVVVDEYGGTSGLVTLEDVLEEIVGDISDEFDDDEIQYSKLDEFNYIFEGKTALVDIYKILDIEGTEFEEAKSESDTLAGFAIEQAGKILKKGERIKFSNYTLQIEAADLRKVKRIKLTIHETKQDED